jgi:GTP-binding protein
LRALKKRGPFTGRSRNDLVGTVAPSPSLIVSAADPRQFPVELAGEQSLEIAFLGRSNVGKSSLLNKLAGQRELAYTSSRPGCTGFINFYQIEAGLRFVDLPGYGYADVPVAVKRAWKDLIDAYLVGRRSLGLSFLVLDARRGWMDMDLELKAWLELHNRRFHVIVTKADKLKSNNQRIAAMTQVQKHLVDHEAVPFSALDGRGVRQIWQVISKIKNNQ